MNRRLWWGRAARAAGAAGFAVAVIAYLVPWASGESDSNRPFASFSGWELIPISLYVMANTQFPVGLAYFAAFALPMLLAIAGLVLVPRKGRRWSTIRLILGALGFAGLGGGYLYQPSGGWPAPYFVAMGALLVAAVAASIELVADLRLGASPLAAEVTPPGDAGSREAGRN